MFRNEAVWSPCGENRTSSDLCTDNSDNLAFNLDRRLAHCGRRGILFERDASSNSTVLPPVAGERLLTRVHGLVDRRRDGLRGKADKMWCMHAVLRDAGC